MTLTAVTKPKPKHELRKTTASPSSPPSAITYQSYSTYKDSGVEWLGDVPAHWDVRRVATLFSEIDEEGEPNLPILSVSIHHGVSDGELDDSELDRKVTRSEDRSKYKCVAAGDLVYNMMRAWQGAFGAVNVDGLVSPAYVVARPIGKLPSLFADFLLRTPNAVEEMRRRSVGVTDFRLRLYWDEFKNIFLPVPPLEEQADILCVLSRETAKIEALISEQERLMELLKEKRQAVISHAVTKGLNPDAPMKDSGVEWLGWVPAHWSTAPLKYVTEHIVDCPHETPTYADEGEYFVIRTADLGDGRLLSDQMKRVDLSEYQSRISRLALIQDDIVYSREGERWGHAALVDSSCKYCLGQRMMQFRCNSAVRPEFLMWSLNSEITYLQGAVDTVGATSPHVNVDTIRNFDFAIPPIAEQETIAKFLNAMTSGLDSLTDEAVKGVQLLAERRTAIISAAVTGKIDVRHLANADAA